MALDRFYLMPLNRGLSPATLGYPTALEAGTAARDAILNGRGESGTKIAVVKLVAVVELDNPQTKSTLADNL